MILSREQIASHVELQGSANLDDLDLAGIDLSGLAMVACSFRRANLAGANLSHANLAGADFAGANLLRADFTQAKLDHARFYTGYDPRTDGPAGASLIDARLIGADLTAANLMKTDLRGADLTAANLKCTNLHTATYDSQTRWPQGFQPAMSGALCAAVATSSQSPQRSVQRSQASTGCALSLLAVSSLTLLGWAILALHAG